MTTQQEQRQLAEIAQFCADFSQWLKNGQQPSAGTVHMLATQLKEQVESIQYIGTGL